MNAILQLLYVSPAGYSGGLSVCVLLFFAFWEKRVLRISYIVAGSERGGLFAYTPVQ